MRNPNSWARLVVAVGILTVVGHGQVVIHSGEEIFVITIQGTAGLKFRGSYLTSASTGELRQQIEGGVPAEFKVQGSSVYLNVQKQSPEGELAASISKNGATVKKQSTEAPYGVVALSSPMPPWGAPRQTEFRVDGSVKFAFLNLTSETGDAEQRLVPIPFTKTFFAKEGWIVGLLAQKTRVTRPDPLHPDQIEIQDDGVRGSVHVSIVVNGTVLDQAEASKPYGVASATVRIP